MADSDNVQTVEHFAHYQDFSFSAAIHPGEKWGLDLGYAYDSIYSRTDECFTSSAPGPGAVPSPTVCQQASLPLQVNGFYNQPTQSGNIGFVFTPVKRLHATGGYRISSVDGRPRPSISARCRVRCSHNIKPPMAHSPSISPKTGVGKEITTTTAMAKERPTRPRFRVTSMPISLLSQFVMLSSRQCVRYPHSRSPRRITAC